jgi:hypothetical protein
VKKKILAVLHKPKNALVIKLSSIDQNVFCSFDKEIMYPAAGGWRDIYQFEKNKKKTCSQIL